MLFDMFVTVKVIKVMTLFEIEVKKFDFVNVKSSMYHNFKQLLFVTGS